MSIINRRIGRAGFCGAILLLVALWLSFVGHTRFVPSPFDPGLAFPIGSIVLLATFLITLWRGHDFGEGFWAGFWRGNLPIVGGLVSTVELFFKRGDPGHNAFGPPPRL